MDLEVRMQHSFVAFSSLLFSLLVYVTCCVAIAVLLGFVGCVAIVCKACGGGLGPTRETGKTTKLTAPGCDATDGLDVDVGTLRFSLLFSWVAAAVGPKIGLTVLS